MSSISSIVSARATRNPLSADTAAITRPIWTRDRVPIQAMTPIAKGDRALVLDRFLVRPDPDEDTAYVAVREASLVNFSLTIRRSVRPDRSVAIVGGSVSMTISVSVPDTLETLAARRASWEVALEQNHFGKKTWAFRAEPRRGLDVSLELPAGVAAGVPLVATSPLAGVATITVDLTETGALTWKSALEQGAASTIAGILHVTSSALMADGVVMRLDRRPLDTPLGTLLAGRGPASIRYVDPQQSVVGKLIVVTNDLVDTITVGLRPSEGLAPASSTFGPEGGVLEVPVTAQNIDAIAIDWTTQVAFTPIGWPPIPASGRLTAANTWTEMLKPDSWVASYMLMAIPVDERGQAQPLGSVPGPAQLQGVMNFTAPYVANGLLNSAFAAEYLRPLNIALPRYPGQPFGDVVLTMFATRNGKGGSGTRKLRPEEFNVVALVYPDAHVELRTGLDALPERSSISDALRLMSAI